MGNFFLKFYFFDRTGDLLSVRSAGHALNGIGKNQDNECHKKGIKFQAPFPESIQERGHAFLPQTLT